MLRTSGTLAVVAVTAALAQPLFAVEGQPHWSYAGSTGPTHWGTLEKDYSACSSGKTQSPIDIRNAGVKTKGLPAVDFNYKASPLKIIDNGHTIQINYAPGSFISVGDKRYELVQFHFHRPSEERINGKRYAMVAHLVHKDSDGKLAVVAVLLARGKANPLIKTLWANLPKVKETESVLEAVRVNAADLLPKSKAYYTFAGSLTTPPCSEDVTWFVMRHPTSISTDELTRFAKFYPMNARPTQALNGREVSASK